MKTAEELNALKNEVEALNKKLAELTKEEMEQFAGGGNVLKTDPVWHKRCTNDKCRQKNSASNERCVRCGAFLVWEFS